MKLTFLRGAAVLGLALLMASRAAEAAPSAPPSPAPTARPLPPARAPAGPNAPAFRIPGSPPSGVGWRASPGVNPPVDAGGEWIAGPEYRAAPELSVVPGVPQGRVEQFVMRSTESRYYPGIARNAPGTVDPDNPRTLLLQTHPQAYERTITVYVPRQCQPGAPVPFLVSHDGPPLGKPDQTLPRILDNLIAQGRVPVQVAILIKNGGGDAQGSERGVEYDTMSGKFAEFIEAEVLPAVEKHCGVTLTHDPEGRAAMGISSGAAAAFSMAWFHPEWYRRVISYSGTFVNQQWPFDPKTPGGAWDYHERLIPESPAKPIRIWLQVSDRDLLNPNVLRDDMHDWVEANHRMAAALKAKGYPYQYVFSLNSVHGDKAVREQTLPQALEWIWQGYLSKPWGTLAAKRVSKRVP